MTKNKVLAMAKEKLGEGADSELLLRWLDELESIVRHEVALTHKQSSSSEELFIEDEFVEVYLLYLYMKNDLYLQDTQRYINSLSAFSSAYSDYCDRYNREHIPVGVEKISL